MDKSRRNSLATLVYDCAREVHAITGPGIIPEVFRSCLAHEFRLRGIRFRVQTPVGIHYKGIRIDEKLLCDFIVEEEIAVEIVPNNDKEGRAVQKLNTILTFSGCSLGILLNPSEERLIDGFKKVNNLKKIQV